MSRRRWPLAGAFLAVSFSSLPAQEAPLRPFRNNDDKPVMRAIPVNPPKAVPVDPNDSGTPAATPTPRGTQVRKAKAVATPTPAPKTAAPPPVPEPTDPGDIRMAPGPSGRTADQAQLAVADSYYARKMYAEAVSEYQRYIDQYPTADEIPSAYYRLGECNRRTGSLNAAKQAYGMLLDRYQVGEFVGPAAYRLADIYYQEKNYQSALPYFRKAALRLKEPALVNAAKFYTARCMEATGGAGYRIEASELYRELTGGDRETNPFQDASRLSLANLLRQADRTAEALKIMQALAKQTDNPDIKAEATVRAGEWEMDVQQPAKAEQELTEALKLPNLGIWKEVALIGLLQVWYDTNKYQKVVDQYAATMSQVSAENVPKVLIIACTAQRQLTHYAESIALADRVVKEYPNTVYAKEAAYEKLANLYNSNDPGLIPQIDDYLTNLPEPSKRDQVVLMKAEALYRKQDFQGAGAAYAAIAHSQQLPGALKSEAVYRLGDCAMQTHDYELAQKTFSEFISDYPTHKEICSARANRGAAEQNQKNLVAAEKDYLEVIKKYPKCPDRAFALLQEALIRGQLNDNQGMSEYFRLLLKDYPDSPAVPAAHFWIGTGAFEAKEYKAAIEDLTLARKLDPEQFFERASQRLMLSYFFSEDRDALAREVGIYKEKGKQPVQSAILEWLGTQYFAAKNFESAEKYLQELSERPDPTPRVLLKLGESQLALQKWPEAVATLQKYLTSVHEPELRARGLLEVTAAQIGMKDFDAAQKSVDEAITLQPEGPISGEGRISAGDIQAAKGNWTEAAKMYTSVAVILDNDEITPRALEKAVEAFKKAGKDDEAKKTFNQLQSRYPEYLQHKKVAQ